MELKYLDDKNIDHKPLVNFAGIDDHKNKKLTNRGGFMLAPSSSILNEKKTYSWSMFTGSVIYGKDTKGKKIENGLFELTNHALAKRRKEENIVDKQAKKDKKKLNKEKKIWKAKVAKSRQKAHEAFDDSDESSEEEEDSSDDSDDEHDLPYLH